MIIPNENTILKIDSHKTLTHIIDHSIFCTLVDCIQPAMNALFEESGSLA